MQKSKINPRGFRYMLVEKIDHLYYPVSRHTTEALAETQKIRKSDGIDRRQPLEILPYNKRFWAHIAQRA